MKKTLLHKLVYIAIILAIPGALFSQSVNLVIPDRAVSGKTIGDTVCLTIYTDSSLTGMGIFSYQLEISYSSNRLHAIDVDASGMIAGQFGNPVFNTRISGSQELLSVAGAGTTPLSGTGNFLQICFVIQDYGNTQLYFTGSSANFFNEGSPPILFDNGSINVIAPLNISIIPYSITLAVGESQQFTTLNGTPPFTWGLTNPSVGTINSSGMFTATNPGITQITVTDNNGNSGTSGNISIKAVRLTVVDTNSLAGTSVDMRIHTTDLTPYNITSGSFTITFDGNKLTFIGPVVNGTLLQGYNAPIWHSPASGLVNIAFAGTTPLTGSGTLIKLRFQLCNNNCGSSIVNIQNAIFNQSYSAVTTSGLLVVNPLPILSLSPNSGTLVYGETLQFTVGGGTPPYTWSTTDPSVADINTSGLLTPLHGGVVQVMVSDANGASATSGNITIYDTRVRVANTTGMLNSVVDLPVYIDSFPSGQSVQSVEGTFSFKTPELAFIDIITAGSRSDGWSLVKNASSNTVTYAIAGANAFTEPGILFYLRFQLTTDLSLNEFAYVNINSITLNEGIPLPLPVNGGITGSNCAPITLHFTPVHVSCHGFSDGAIDLTVAGGAPPFTYQWSNGATTEDISGLSAGNYAVTVIDSNNCPATGSTTITQPDSLSVIKSVTDVSIYGGNDGAVDLTVSGGTYPYTFSWSTGATTEDISGLTAGTYYFTVQDNNGCLVMDSAVVNQPPPCFPPANLWVTRITPTSARLNWDSAQNAYAYQIRGRGIGVGTWTYVNIPPGSPGFKDVYGLYNDATIEWQIRTFCGGLADTSGWSVKDTFTTGCQPPDTNYTFPILSDAARLNWTKAPSAQGYEIRGKKVGGPWITLLVGSGSTLFKDVFGLNPATAYAWKVRTWCDPSGVYKSPYTPIDTFVTLSSRLSAPEKPAVKPQLVAYVLPGSKSIHLEASGIRNGAVQILDPLGREQLNIPVTGGYHRETIDANGWPGGLYLLYLYDGSSQKTVKLVLGF